MRGERRVRPASGVSSGPVSRRSHRKIENSPGVRLPTRGVGTTNTDVFVFASMW